MDTTWQKAIEEWRLTARDAANAQREYDLAFAQAFLASEQKTEALKKADAEVKTTVARAKAEGAAIVERSAHHALVHLRGPEVIVDRRVA